MSAIDERIAGRTLSEWRAFARRDDCLERMVPSDLRQILQALHPGSTGETEGWRELMKELADDLECELQARYPEEARAYPSQAMKFYVEMQPVRRARAMLAAAGGR